MRIATIALLVGATLLAAPTASAEACNGNPSALVEECHTPGNTGGDANTPDVQTTGCIIDLNGQCVPTGANVQDGASVGTWRAVTLYVGVDVNHPLCFSITISCSVSYDTTALTQSLVERVV